MSCKPATHFFFVDAHLRHPPPITTSSCSFIDDECHLRRMWLVKRWSSSFYIIRSALYGIVVLLDQNRLLAETFTRNAQLPPQQPHTSPCCVHTLKRLARLLLLLWRSFFLIPTGSRNFWASLSTIVLQVGSAFLLCGLASFARPALVDFTIDNHR